MAHPITAPTAPPETARRPFPLPAAPSGLAASMPRHSETVPSRPLAVPA